MLLTRLRPVPTLRPAGGGKPSGSRPRVPAIPGHTERGAIQGKTMIKVKPQTHATISRWSKRLFMLVFVAGAVMLGSMGIQGYRNANAILADHSTVTVPVELVEVTQERGRKGRTKEVYHFGYAFEAGGRQFQGAFTTSESNADPYLEDGAAIEVAYANADPARFDRLERLQGQSGLGGLAMRLLIAVAGAALIAFVLHLLVVAKLIVPRPTDAEAAPAG